MVNESSIKLLIQKYLSLEGLLKENLLDSKIEFGFKFVFPPVPMGKIMFVVKPKNKDIVIITIGTQISEPHVNALNSLGNSKKVKFFLDLRKFFLLKDVYFRIDMEEFRYEISDQIFLEEEGKERAITKNDFYNSVRKVFNCDAYSNIILEEYCSGKVKPDSIIKTKELSSGSSEFSLYS